MKIADQVGPWPILSRRVLATGHVATFVEDQLETPDGESLTRQFLVHPGAVAVLALNSDDQVCCLRQYRHPLGAEFLEIPAGLLDVRGEPPLLAAQRELAEEAQLRAESWATLVDIGSSPGGSMETIRVFLAREVAPAPRPDGFVVEGEEAHMQVGWVPFVDLVAGVLSGELTSPTLVAGVGALVAARATDATLRPADAPWPIRDGIQGWLAEVSPGGS